MKLTWTTPPAAAPLLAAIARLDGLPLIDSGIASSVTCAAAGLTRKQLVASAGAVATGSNPPPEIAPLAGLVQDAGNELAHRLRPIREQWEARGPGLLRMLEGLTEPIGVDAATIALAPPMVGGHGVALPGHAAVVFEAVLANPHPDLPETVRLGWLLAQLANGAAPTALVPAVLAAAEAVELATANQATLSSALVAWRLATNQQEAARLAAPLWRWWTNYTEQTAPWRTALQDAPNGPTADLSSENPQRRS